ncbi:hypothetical protein GOP47_0015754 [Adiantum capillus-veneris]|uniref:Uncharacterized protein n=1 Tax=Adiantum capillus-veneris TaxID=13818 RepID=A0A9D4ULE5_ADICA|nr:hypothetical protein GOP47_0015754 [Adiantum capillus-veneris]
MAPGLLYPPLRSSSSRARFPAAPHATSCSSSRLRQAVSAAAVAPTSTPPAVAAAAAAGHGQVPSVYTPSRSIIMPAARASTNSKNVKTEAGRAAARLGDLTSPLIYSSSGSLHHAHDHDDPSSVCLAEMVHQFLEEEEKEDEVQVAPSLNPAGNSTCGRARCNCVDGVSGDEFCVIMDEKEDDESNVLAQVEILQGYNNCSNKAGQGMLRMEVEKAIEELSAVCDPRVRDGLRRCVMRSLRDAGYNAAACKSRWMHGSGLPAGDYEYIDVLLEGSKQEDMAAPVSTRRLELLPLQPRLIVDIDFRTQFEIARPSREYSRMLEAVPKVFVGRAEHVKQVVRMMSHAAKRSFRAQGLMVPPWRKHKYMQAKWLSPIYRRTTNMEPASSHNIATRKRVEEDMKEYRRTYEYTLEASDAFMQNKARPLQNAAKCRDICTAICTSWRLPPLEYCAERASHVASALSIALQNAGERGAVNPVVSVVF